MKKKKHHHQSSENKNAVLLILGVLVIFGFTIYSNTFFAGFHLDDYTYIHRNEIVKNIQDFFNLHVWTNIYQRPVSAFTFALNYRFHEFDLPAYHLVNIIIHILVSIVVYMLTMLLLRIYTIDGFEKYAYQQTVSMFVALFFLSHPLQTQSVNYIVQRMTLLAGLFFIMGTYTYLKARLLSYSERKKRSVIYYLLTLLFFYLATFSKQNAIVLPLVLLVIEILFIRNPDGKPAKTWIFFMVISFVLIGFIVLIGGYLPQETDSISREAYFATQLKVVFKYIQLLFIPVSLNLDPFIEVSKTLLGWKEVLMLLGHLSIIGFGIYFFKKNKLVTFGILWFYIGMLIESTIIPIRDVMFEHRTYLPSYGFHLIFVVLIFKFFIKKNIGIRSISIVLLSIVLVLSVMSFQRNKVWENDFTLWYDVVQKPPVKARGYQYLSAEYVKMKDYEEAMQLLNKAVELEPGNAQIHLNMAVIYQRQQNINAAIKELDKCIQLEPEKESHYVDRATLLMIIGEFEKSRFDLLKAYEIKPNDYSILFKMGVYYIKTNNDKEAIKVLTRAIDLNPVFIDALMNRGAAYMKTKQYNKAIQDFTSILEIDEFNISALNKRASSFFSSRKYSGAIKDYDKLIRIDPKNGTNYKNRAISLIRINKFNKAMEDLNQAQICGIAVEPELIDYVSSIIKKSSF